MLVQSAEDSYAKGLRALSGGRGKEAMALFEAAIRIAWRGRGTPPQARYLSYYGLCLALVANENREGLRCCREAVTLESYNPDIRCNLGRVLLYAGRRAEAYRCFLRGLALGGDHPTIRSALPTTTDGPNRSPVSGHESRPGVMNRSLPSWTAVRCPVSVCGLWSVVSGQRSAVSLFDSPARWGML